MDFQCDQCGRRYRSRESVVGKTVRCKSCGNSFVVSEIADPLASTSPPRDASPGEDTNPFDLPLRPVTATKSPPTDHALATTANPQTTSAVISGGDLQFQIVGSESQYVTVDLATGQTVIAEAGAMMFMDDDIQMDTTTGTEGGLLGKAMSVGKRALTGESLFMTTFTNHGPVPRTVAFASPYPGKMIPMDLDRLGGHLICQKDAFLCGSSNIDVGIAFQKRLGTGLLGGEGFILQKLTGRGTAIVHAGGSMLYRELSVGQRLRVDTGCLMAMGRGVGYDIEFVGGIKNMVFGGEGLVFATLTGPGPVWLQSLPFSRLSSRVTQDAGGGGKGEGSLLGSLGDMLMGD